MTKYSCINCGFGSQSWYGKCPQCNEWNTIKEEVSEIDNNKKTLKKAEIKPLNKIASLEKNRLKTDIFELDRVLGGGFVGGEVILMSGEPGIGKSTLILKALQKLRVLYVSGEESGEQIKHRADRLKINLSNFFFTEEIQVEAILNALKNQIKDFDIFVIDSIQTVYSKDNEGSAGSVSQLKISIMKITEFAKNNNIPVIVIGHVNKDGDIAGPKLLEHLVDCVLHLEGEKNSYFRILRSLKNRFGPTDEVGIFEMKDEGLVEVENPLIFLENNENIIGKSTAAVYEGNRILFFEIQALVVPTSLTIPRRIVKGIDYNKFQIILAVLRKNLSLHLDKFDVYVNVVGGVDIKSPTVDLSVAAAVISSVKNISLKDKSVFCGEIGLLGEIRKNYFEDKIKKECERFGFKSIFTYKTAKNIKELARLVTN